MSKRSVKNHRKATYRVPSSKCRKTGKVRYRDPLSAKIALASTHHSKSSRREENRYYRCQFCGGFHLTSTPRRTHSHG